MPGVLKAYLTRQAQGGGLQDMQRMLSMAQGVHDMQRSSALDAFRKMKLEQEMAARAKEHALGVDENAAKNRAIALGENTLQATKDWRAGAPERTQTAHNNAINLAIMRTAQSPSAALRLRSMFDDPSLPADSMIEQIRNEENRAAAGVSGAKEGAKQRQIYDWRLRQRNAPGGSLLPGMGTSPEGMGLKAYYALLLEQAKARNRVAADSDPLTDKPGAAAGIDATFMDALSRLPPDVLMQVLDEKLRLELLGQEAPTQAPAQGSGPWR